MSRLNDLIDRSDLQGLVPVVRNAAILLIKRCLDNGVEIRITHGYRSNSEQQKLFNQGRLTPGNIVTNARPGHSYHNFGLAIDFVLIKSGYNMQADADGDGIADWLEVVTQAKLCGFDWGGDWISFKDYPHFEMPFGFSTADLRAGAVVSKAQMDAVQKNLDVLSKGENDMTEELKAFKEEYAKAMSAMEQRVKALEKKVNISGNQTPPDVYGPAIEAAKKAGAITTSNDKNASELKMIQMLYNLGLFGPKEG